MDLPDIVFPDSFLLVVCHFNKPNGQTQLYNQDVLNVSKSIWQHKQRHKGLVPSLIAE